MPCLMNMIFLAPPSFDEQIYFDDTLPPIYDDYIDKSGFGEVMTLFNYDSTILEEVTIVFDKVAIYDDYCDDTYAIKNTSLHVDHDKNDLCDSYFIEFAPTIINEKDFAYVESNKISMLVDHDKNVLCDSYIVEFIHDATKSYYERGRYGFTYLNNIKLPLFMLKFLKLHYFAFLC